MPKISIIVPVYNTENYLHKCIDSILMQTFSDFELLLIDDGSTDNSGVICDEYSLKDRRIIVFHTQNNGASFARNIGLNHAKGDWITFIDSDDWLESNAYLETLYPIDNVDFSVIYYVNNQIDRKCDNKIYYKHEMNSFLSDCLLKIILMVDKFFKRDIIERNHLRFDSAIAYAEDSLFIYNYLLYVTSVHVIMKNEVNRLYYYNSGASNLSKRNYNWQFYLLIIDKQFNIYRELERKFNWDGRKMRNETVFHFFDKYIKQVCCNSSVIIVAKELKKLLKDNRIRQAIQENEHRTWKGRFIDWLLLCHCYVIYAFYSCIKYKLRKC